MNSGLTQIKPAAIQRSAIVIVDEKTPIMAQNFRGPTALFSSIERIPLFRSRSFNMPKEFQGKLYQESWHKRCNKTGATVWQ
jgi:hypothetical protein